MKKMVLTVAVALVSLAASANFQKSSLVSFQDFYHPFSETVDSASVEKTKVNEELILSKVAFYNVERIVIMNNKKQYIRIENNMGRVILESKDSIDITVPAGDYYVYTTAKHTTAFYK